MDVGYRVNVRHYMGGRGLVGTVVGQGYTTGLAWTQHRGSTGAAQGLDGVGSGGRGIKWRG